MVDVKDKGGTVVVTIQPACPPPLKINHDIRSPLDPEWTIVENDIPEVCVM